MSRGLQVVDGAVEQQEELIVRASRATVFGPVVNGIAHELRNPVQALSLGVRSLVRITEAEEAARFAEMLQREAARLSPLLDLLGHPFRKRGGRTPVDLGLVGDSIRTLHHHQRLPLVDLQVQLPSGMAKVLGDATDIEHLFLNLVTNAKEGVDGQGGEVRVRTLGAVEGVVVVTVDDSGAGIGVQDRARIFDPFFTTKPGALGLGLAAARILARRSRADIAVSASPDLGGARFEVTLPVWAPDSAVC